MVFHQLLTTVLFSATIATAPPPYLLVLGVGHFANHHRDLVNSNVEDVLTPARQREMTQMVAALAATRPNHVSRSSGRPPNKLNSTNATLPIERAAMR